MDDWLKSGHLCERSIGTSSKRRSLDPCNERYVTTCDDDNDYLMSTKNVIRPRKNTRKDEENQYDDKITTNDFLSMKWRLIKAENLDLQYAIVFNKTRADEIFDKLERDTTYFSGDLTRVFVFGKWHDVPRKTVAYGDEGLTYTYSGRTIAALPWTQMLQYLKLTINQLTGCSFNFVLINRYNDGKDHIGEHRDDEKDLYKFAPIASLSFGQHRDFVLRHCDSRGKNSKRHIPPITLTLEHGSLLLMNYPTNCYWYHSLPVRKNVLHPRINLTFRVMVAKAKSNK